MNLEGSLHYFSEITLPEITLPEITLQEITLPEITLPEITLPEITLPEVICLEKSPSSSKLPFRTRFYKTDS
ncbi:hypothetical protein [Methanosarcina sp. 1.H.T.1A.1]|uniref:hypothetical protein n=1 Tax=Methanosarcina sp. 1.H.T.1A.1 TaxID=1483602 RepID=UPI0012DFECDA|nr:hypothetical protein [Methanosarcina sp. 1.H.T.1A.1]